MLSNYRTSTNFNEIVKILHQSSSDTKAFLWQNDGEKRYVFEIKDLVVNERFNTFQVKVSNHGAFKHNSKKPTYAKFSLKETVFKVEVISQIAENISLSLPSEVSALELRDQPRTKFKPSDKKSVSLKIQIEVVQDATQEMEFQIIDISSGGISIVITESDIKYFEDGSFFEMHKLQGQLIEESYELEMVYSQRFRFKSQGRVKSAYKIGLKSLSSIAQKHIEFLYV